MKTMVKVQNGDNLYSTVVFIELIERSVAGVVHAPMVRVDPDGVVIATRSK